MKAVCNGFHIICHAIIDFLYIAFEQIYVIPADETDIMYFILCIYIARSFFSIPTNLLITENYDVYCLASPEHICTFIQISISCLVIRNEFGKIDA